MQNDERTIEVTRTYLQMTSPGDLAASPGSGGSVRIDKLNECPASFFRFLYREVGRFYHWTDRLGWDDQEIRDYLGQSNISLWVMYVDGSPAGYFELSGHDDGSTEIAYFGLLPEFLGRGLGKHLLNEAVRQAWNTGPNRVWLHTCTLDDPAALPNYLKRGFKAFNEEKYFTIVSDEEQQQGKWRKA